MADVVVVGAGLGGLASAARLAKLGHAVIVLERGKAPGGLLGIVGHDGFVWDAHPMQITLPAVLRDLFRKSGRPLERYLDLEHARPARRHVFDDGTRLDLPTGSRSEQYEAIAATWDTRAAEFWTAFVDAQADRWNLLRASVLDVPTDAETLSDRRLAKQLLLRTSLERFARKAFRHTGLRALATFPAHRRSLSPKSQPALTAVEAYVERTFGVWNAPGGSRALGRVLMERMSERKVEVRYGCQVTGVTGTTSGATGVEVAGGGTLACDIVVAAVDPSKVFAAWVAEPRSMRRTYVGLRDAEPSLPREIVLHGDPTIVAFGSPPDAQGNATWVVESPSGFDGDVIAVMAGRGLDLRARVAVTVESHGGAEPQWTGPHVHCSPALHPLPGLYCLGTQRPLGGSIPYVAWEAAHVASLSTPDGAIRSGADSGRRRPSTR